MSSPGAGRFLACLSQVPNPLGRKWLTNDLFLMASDKRHEIWAL